MMTKGSGKIRIKTAGMKENDERKEESKEIRKIRVGKDYETRKS